MTSVTVTGEAHGERAASYRTLTGARLAALHLLDKGFQRAVAVVPRGIEVVPEQRLRRRRAIALRTGVATGVWVGVAAGVAVASGFALSTIAWWSVAGAVAGLITGSVLSRVERRKADERELQPDRVVATRFDVVCSDDAKGAAHLLARWWDPAAQPAKRDA